MIPSFPCIIVMSTLITLITLYRAVSVLSLFVTLPLPPLSLFRDFLPLRLGSLRTFTYGGGFACVVSVSMFALLRAFVLISAWSQSLNFTWHPSNLRQKGSPHFPCCLHLCVVILVSISVMSALSFPYRVAHRVPLLIWRLYIFIYAAMAQRVSFIYLALFVSSLVIDNSLFFLIFLSSMCCSFLPSFPWADIACTGDDFRDFRAAYSLGATDCVSGFPPFGQLFYGGLAGPRYLLEENI